MNTPIIDVHAHVGNWDAYSVTDDQQKYIKTMDDAGIDKCFVSCIFYGDSKTNIDVVHKFVSQNPKRFGGFAHISSNYIDEAIPELERSFKTLGMKAVKIYPPYSRYPVTHPSWMPIFEWCNENHIPVKSHTQYGGTGYMVNDDLAWSDLAGRPILFIELAQKFPNIKWILAHAGNMQEGREECVQAAIECPNIYLEICTSYGDQGTIEYLVDSAGDDRILYGSDIPLMDPRFHIGRIITANISLESKKKILGLNAIKLLQLTEFE